MTLRLSSIAVVVVHYESPHTLAQTVANLCQYLTPDQIVVVDNSSSLDSAQFSEITVLSDGINRGYAGGVNYGIQYVKESIPEVQEVLVCTHEAKFREGALASLLSTASDFPQGHLVAPRLVTADESGLEVTWSNGGFYSFPFFYPQHDTSPEATGSRRARWVDGAAFLIDFESWRKVGGVPEEFFMYMEDVALGELCRKHEVPVIVNRDAIVEQTANGPSRHLAIRNRVLLAWRYMANPAKAVVLTEVLLRQAVMSVHPSRLVRAKARESRSAIRSALDLVKKLSIDH